MCGRFANQLDWIEQWVDLLGAWPEQATQGFNIAPTQQIAAFTTDGGHAMRWGLVPRWSPTPKTNYATFNAKLETVAGKASFRNAWQRSQRCVVPVLGYFEWQTTENGKTPYFICNPSGEPLLLAGLWEHWDGDGESLDSCTLLTRDAIPEIGHIHTRMPVIIDKLSLEAWYGSPPEAISDLALADPPPLRHYVVSSFVNSTRHQGEQCTAPVRLRDLTRQPSLFGGGDEV